MLFKQLFLRNLTSSYLKELILTKDGIYFFKKSAIVYIKI